MSAQAAQLAILLAPVDSRSDTPKDICLAAQRQRDFGILSNAMKDLHRIEPVEALVSFRGTALALAMQVPVGISVIVTRDSSLRSE